ncbi:pyridoxal-phosphate dependent enzyme [Candidatus Bathyarchaeota archaeon]|nr:pyridoxal-phosphate dependent enzyme [Candidatus Bathyarchaeota archaeon]
MLRLSQIYEAQKRIRRWARRTPMEYSIGLSDICGGDVWLKLENYQVTGSFKIRGATNKILSLTEEEMRKGVVTSSSGNHAQGVGYVSRELGIKARVIVPENTPDVKIQAIERYGVDLTVHGEEYMDAERMARRLEEEEGMTFISPYNDLELIMGQGTIGLEMLEEQPKLDVVLVPVGGGGLASGVASVFKATTNAKIIGVQSVASPVMYECIRKGEIHDIPLSDSYAEGLHGGLEPASISFEICRESIDEWIILEEKEILEAIQYMLHEHHMLVEGAGAVGVGALMSKPQHFEEQKVGVVISGGNLSMEILEHVT